MSNLCPCSSGKLYEQCCAPYHHGTPAPNALCLMRSRYSAYALQLVDYIIQTTHPLHLDSRLDLALRKMQTLQFTQTTQFEKLEILEFIDGEKKAFVTFHAHLRQNKHDASFIEKSHFEKLDGYWLYLSGTILR